MTRGRRRCRGPLLGPCSAGPPSSRINAEWAPGPPRGFSLRLGASPGPRPQPHSKGGDGAGKEAALGPPALGPPPRGAHWGLPGLRLRAETASPSPRGGSPLRRGEEGLTGPVVSRESRAAQPDRPVTCHCLAERLAPSAGCVSLRHSYLGLPQTQHRGAYSGSPQAALREAEGGGQAGPSAREEQGRRSKRCRPGSGREEDTDGHRGGRRLPPSSPTSPVELGQRLRGTGGFIFPILMAGKLSQGPLLTSHRESQLPRGQSPKPSVVLASALEKPA